LLLQPDPKERLSLDEIATHPFFVEPASLAPYPTYETNRRNPQSGSNEFQAMEQLQKKKLMLPHPPGFEHTVPTIIACSPCAVNEIAFYFEQKINLIDTSPQSVHMPTTEYDMTADL
jgi:hypothetical protein